MLNILFVYFVLAIFSFDILRGAPLPSKINASNLKKYTSNIDLFFNF